MKSEAIRTDRPQRRNPPRKKITPALALSIRELYAQRRANVVELARFVGVAPTTIGLLLDGKTHADAGGPLRPPERKGHSRRPLAERNGKHTERNDTINTTPAAPTRPAPEPHHLSTVCTAAEAVLKQVRFFGEAGAELAEAIRHVRATLDTNDAQ